MLTRSIAKEGAQDNILCNALRVGVTNTAFHDKNPGKSLENRKTLIPLQRVAEPDEIVESLLFLSSEKSSFTTGSIIDVTGGE